MEPRLLGQNNKYVKVITNAESDIISWEIYRSYVFPHCYTIKCR